MHCVCGGRGGAQSEHAVKGDMEAVAQRALRGGAMGQVLAGGGGGGGVGVTATTPRRDRGRDDADDTNDDVSSDDAVRPAEVAARPLPTVDSSQRPLPTVDSSQRPLPTVDSSQRPAGGKHSGRSDDTRYMTKAQKRLAFLERRKEEATSRRLQQREDSLLGGERLAQSGWTMP
jgi:hypothetical protein